MSSCQISFWVSCWTMAFSQTIIWSQDMTNGSAWTSLDATFNTGYKPAGNCDVPSCLLIYDNGSAWCDPVDLSNYFDISVEFTLACEMDDTCFYFDYSINGGSWINQFSIGNVQKHQRNQTMPAECNQISSFRIQFRFSCAGVGSDCWVDTLNIKGTLLPTTSPTIHPSVDPTTYPTNDPTTDPTNDPTAEPTIYPTTDPTTVPTVDPTIIPTQFPSALPSVTPTEIPTTPNPTSQPTSQPTSDPSYPTIQPTANPSYNPTKIPSNIPTIHPSFYPTQMDTLHSTREEEEEEENPNINDEGDDSDLGLIIGVVIGIFVFIIIVIICIFKLRLKSKNKINYQNNKEIIEFGTSLSNQNVITKKDYKNKKTQRISPKGVGSVSSVNDDLPPIIPPIIKSNFGDRGENDDEYSEESKVINDNKPISKLNSLTNVGDDDIIAGDEGNINDNENNQRSDDDITTKK